MRALAVTMLLMAAAPARATLIAEESFAYTAGSDLRGQNGGTGWAGAWDTAATGTAGSFTMVTLAGEPAGVSTTGLALGIKNGVTNETRIFRPLDVGPTSAAAAAGLVETVATAFGTNAAELGKPGTTLWLGFIARGHAGSVSAGSHLFEGVGDGTDVCSIGHMHDYTENDKLGEVLFIGRGASNTEYGYERTCGHGIACSGTFSLNTCNGNDYQSTVDYSSNVVHWVVMRLDFGMNLASSNAAAVTITMWIDPATGSTADLDPTTASALTQVGHTALGAKTQWVESEFHFNTVELQSVTDGSELDEYRIGTTFADVLGPVTPRDMAVVADLEPPRDLAGRDLPAPRDLAGTDLAGVDLSSAAGDLAASPGDGGPGSVGTGGGLGAAKAGCSCDVGGRAGATPWMLVAVAWVLRRRLRARRGCGTPAV